MEKYRSIFQVARMAKILNVSRSGFYSYLKRPRSVRELANEQLLEKIKEVHKRSHQIYGYQRITHALKNDGAPSKNRVHRLMEKKIPLNMVFEILTKEYKLDEEKANLIIDI